MTTLDDAAERQRLAELHAYAIFKHPASEVLMTTGEVTGLWNLAWAEATEAAALKCEAEQILRMDMGEDADHAYNNACRDCAAAIRGR